MIKNHCIFVCLFALIILSGCVADGSHVVTGKPRPAFSPRLVQIYDFSPTNSETIGIVSGFAFGWQGQKETDKVFEVLRQNAGEIGANGISEIKITVSPHDGTKAQGKAIFVP